MTIDSHHHLWNYSAAEYGWIGGDMREIARDFTVADIVEAAGSVGVTGTVVVQARQTLKETNWLLDLATQYDFLVGVVGWVPLADDDLPRVLDELAEQAKLKGVRHVVHDEPGDDFILGDAFNQGVATAVDRGYVYDILIFHRHLPQTIEFVKRHPDAQLVVDHIAKPAIAAGEMEPWATQIRELAEFDNVACKVSGVATEAKWDDWSFDSVRPYLDTVLDAFGPRRLMYGSDWPVCLLASSYERWIETVREWAAPLTEDEQQWLFHRTARQVYRLDEV